MRNGTQEELDAAREDATKLPYGAKFKTKDGNNPYADDEMPIGVEVYRGCTDGVEDYMGNSDSVAFVHIDGSDYWYVCSKDLEPIND